MKSACNLLKLKLSAGWAAAFLISVLLLGGASAQSAAAQGGQPQASQPSVQTGSPAQQSKETHISSEQAKELFRSVDEIVKFASQDSGLPIHHSIKRALVDREQVQKFVEDRIEKDDDAKRLRRSEMVLKKFGLLPRNFDLRTFLVALLREQVAGYYDPKTKTVNLLDWIDPELQKPVLAHELTHALQDQNYKLEHWMKYGPADHKKDPEVESDEQAAARQAVVEGQGMIVLLDYALAPTGQSVLKAPAIADAMKSGVLAGSPLFNSAPLYVKNSLIFPYTYGLDFERALLAKGGPDKAFASVLRNPPLSTRQVMQPATYLSGERLEPLVLPDIQRVLGKEYEKLDVGSIGEFDVSVMIEQFADEDVAKALWPQWRGGYYYAARPHAAANQTALLYVSRWATADQATQFAGIYGSSLRRKYKNVVAVEAPKPSVQPTSPGAVQVSIANESTRWNTEDGPVFVEPHGKVVLVMEGFDDISAAKLRDAVLAADGQH